MKQDIVNILNIIIFLVKSSSLFSGVLFTDGSTLWGWHPPYFFTDIPN